MQKSIVCGIILALSLQTFLCAQGGVMQANITNPSKEAKTNALKNPFGLVYEGAITKSEKGKVNIKSITYTSRGLKIAANLYLPSDFDLKAKIAAIIVAHPNGGVKEQVAGLYAQKLAESGYITLAFDAAYQGASEGLLLDVSEYGIHTINVMPAGFRTEFLGTSMVKSAMQVSTYDARRKAFLDRSANYSCKQAGNPQKFAEILHEVSRNPKPPFSLFMGEAAFTSANNKIKWVSEDIKATESYAGKAADFSDSAGSAFDKR